MCNFELPPISQRTSLHEMDTKTHISKIELDSDDGFLVTFSDGTSAGYVVEELLMLRPARESVPVMAMPEIRPAVPTNVQAISAHN